MHSSWWGCSWPWCKAYHRVGKKPVFPGSASNQASASANTASADLAQNKRVLTTASFCKVVVRLPSSRI